MFVLGVTGKICTGKTTFCKDFKAFTFLPGINTQQIPIINTDEIWADILRDEKRSDIHLLLVNEFGIDILSDNGCYVSKIKLADKIFDNSLSSDASAEYLVQLQEIAWPIISDEVKRKLKFYKMANFPFVILDSANLFESELNKLCDFIIVLNSAVGERKVRLMNRIDDCSSRGIRNALKTLLIFDKAINITRDKKSPFVSVCDVSVNSHNMDNHELWFQPSISEISNMLNYKEKNNEEN